MSTTSSNTAFFSFGPGDSFISKSFEGLRYRNLPLALHELIAGGSVVDVHWAALGPVPESWVLSFKDANGKSNLGWGTSVPSTLQKVLTTLTPSRHLRVFLGPPPSTSSSTHAGESSFIAWDPTFIRWSSLPAPLEACIQSWLTPAGWKSGAPKAMVWNAKGACFAKSEFGDVVYRMGSREGMKDDDWPPFQDTIREWNAEHGFKWSDVVYLNLDPRDAHQFIAIRTDGTWAGSIDSDANEEALEAFALNFFAQLKPAKSSSTRPQARPNPNSKPHTQSQTQQNHSSSGNIGNGRTNNSTHPPPRPPKVDPLPPATAQAHYEHWATQTAAKLASALAANTSSTSPITTTDQPQPKPPPPTKIQTHSPTDPPPHTSALLTSFPYLPPALTTCARPPCILTKSDPAGLRACKHDVERTLRASGSYSYAWLRQERIRWHPDRFARLCDHGYRDKGRSLAEEMFKIVDGLVGDAERSA